jgi:hypothetical protein
MLSPTAEADADELPEYIGRLNIRVEPTRHGSELVCYSPMDDRVYRAITMNRLPAGSAYCADIMAAGDVIVRLDNVQQLRGYQSESEAPCEDALL